MNFRYFAEFVGTFILVLLGTGSIVLSKIYPEYISGFEISLVFGLTVALLIQLLGKKSDCHINPAVSIAFVLKKELPLKNGLIYVFLQCLGAILASSVLKYYFPSDADLGNTIPKLTLLNTYALEAIMSYILMFGILVSVSKTKLQPFIALIVGGIVFLEAYFGGPFTGASMNPARTLGPTVLTGDYTNLWLYIIAPIMGMFLAIKLKK